MAWVSIFICVQPCRHDHSAAYRKSGIPTPRYSGQTRISLNTANSRRASRVKTPMLSQATIAAPTGEAPANARKKPSSAHRTLSACHWAVRRKHGNFHAMIIKDTRGFSASDVEENLFVTQRIHRLQAGCTVGRINSEEQPNRSREKRRQQDGTEVDGRIERVAAGCGNASDQ